jgi:predicted TIM-barrel fold metal-dependent hydrolase
VIVDCHTHVFSPEIIKHRRRYVESDPCFALLFDNKKAKMVNTEQLVESMDKTGIDRAIIQNIGWATHELCVETNDYILESISKYPQRLIGFCAVQPLAFTAALEEIKRCAAGGAMGIGELRPDIQMFDFNDDEIMKPFVASIIEHNMVLSIHASEPVGHLYSGKGTITPDCLYPFIKHYPKLNILLAHWGGGLCFYGLMPEVKESLKNVYFDSAASPYLYNQKIYRHASEILGAQKILFGSDFPLMAQSRVINEVYDSGLDIHSQKQILGGNARHLFQLD